ncbi:MAG: cobalamin biosynthesis protein CbiD, partial [Candidatus Melainabacteria bacterium]|nr:cobalamin biosynthesis protein CbiD [Candidatus Melainabacteria bacterium]
RGRTTGSCAAAAARAAVTYLLQGEVLEEVEVLLPDGKFYLPVPIQAIKPGADGSVRAEVIKMAGDDPDQTDGATIFAEVSLSQGQTITLVAAEGVGTVTAPGLRVKVGEPAINPVPRRMILSSAGEALAAAGKEHAGLEIKIGCVNGEAIAQKTFNPRLGIKGGISILGTTGIVEPMSLSAYKAAIEVYIRVALSAPGDGGKVAYLPGNIGISFARKTLNLNDKQTVHISNFIGFALESTESFLQESDSTLDELWLLGHPGKLCKTIDGVFDTHSRKSELATGAIARLAEKLSFPEEECRRFANANTVEAIIEILQEEHLRPRAQELWQSAQAAVAQAASSFNLSRVKKIKVKLFDMSGNALVGN